MKGSLVFLDTETTGLNPWIHEIVEVAYAVDDGPVIRIELPHDLERAEEKALEVNRYHERNLSEEGETDWQEKSAAMEIALREATLVGANPAFDAGFLRTWYGFTNWHYRLLDVEAFAAGAFGWRVPVSLKDTATTLRDLGFEIPAPDHSAVADVETTRAIYRACLGMGAHL